MYISINISRFQFRNTYESTYDATRLGLKRLGISRRKT